MPRSADKTISAILDAGFGLFHKRGYTRVSMDEIAAAAGVTKRTLYYHYDSKDALVSAVLTRRLEQSLRSIQSWGEPQAACQQDFIEGIFTRLARWARTSNWAGSGFTRLTLELADLPGHPVRKAASQHKADIEGWIEQELARLGSPDPPHHARALCTLIEGATVLTLIHGDPEYIASACQTALLLLDNNGSNTG